LAGGTGGVQSDCPMQLEGWATVSGDGVSTTTGGGNVTPVRPTSAQQLMDYTSDGTPRVIEIEGSFNVPRLQVASNRTLIGIGTNATINGGMRIRGYDDDNVGNVIVRNVRVNGATTDVDGDAMQVYFARHVWIDHCEVWDGPDANLDVVHASNWVTISWTVFRYTGAAPDPSHKFSNLFGHSDNNAGEDRGRLKVTVHHNWWAEGVTERMPRVRFGEIHVFNNYYSSAGNNYCLRAGLEAHILSESNYFDGVNSPHVYNNSSDEQTAYITRRDNIFNNTTGTNVSGGGGTPFSSPPYSATIDDAASVPGLVQACAGPR
jgi:pectate lyase